MNLVNTILLDFLSISLKLYLLKYDHGNSQGRPQDLGGGGQEFFFQIWEFACREATCCAWRSHAHC